MMKHLSAWRFAGIALFIALTAAGLVWHSGWGTLSSFGPGVLSLICPLGGLESWVAGGSITLRAVAGLTVAVILILLLGRVFCGWMCPTPLIEKCFGVREKAVKRRVIPIVSVQKKTKPAAQHTGPLVVLAGALCSSAVFGFPVFCLICPVGLTFGVVIGLGGLFHTGIADWNIALFLGFLILEIVVFRRWCHQLCPLGALTSLIARFNRFFRPSINPGKCLRLQGIDCNVCHKVCPEELDPTRGGDLSRCTKCHVCAENCPAGAITFPVVGRHEPVEAYRITPEQTGAASATVPPLPPDGDISALTKWAKAESERCVLCGECEQSCPAHQNISEWMQCLRENRPRAAAKIMFEAGALPEICSRVCPRERLCEKACARSRLDAPVAIHALEQTVADIAMRRGELRRLQIRSSKRVAIVGAGPAGLACAGALVERGIGADIYDENSTPGGLLTYGIPAGKLDKRIVRTRISALEAAGVQFYCNRRAGRDMSYMDLLENYDAVFIAAGAKAPRPLEVPGSEGRDVIQAIDFLAQTCPGEAVQTALRPVTVRGRHVAVLGGGLTAYDCASEAVRLGAASVSVLYRNDLSRMRIGPAARQALQDRGVEIIGSAEAVRVQRESDGSVSGIALADGRLIPAGLVLVAFGFTPLPDKELEALGVQFDAEHRIVLRAGSMQTSVDRLYAGGDRVRGADLVASAAGDGRLAGLEIADFLENERRNKKTA